MPMLSVFVDDRTLAILTDYAIRHHRTVEELASAAVSEEALRALPPHLRAPWVPPLVVYFDEETNK